MFVKTKNGNLKVIVDHEKDSTYFYLKAVNDRGKKIGCLTFTVEKDMDQTWLNIVETEKPYQRQGVASALIAAMEYISIKKFNISHIVGTFMPYEKTRRDPFKLSNKIKVEQYTQNFYEKNGYNVELWSALLKKPLTKKSKDYEKLVDCSYEEFMSFDIDYDAIEEWQR